MIVYPFPGLLWWSGGLIGFEPCLKECEQTYNLHEQIKGHLIFGQATAASIDHLTPTSYENWKVLKDYVLVVRWDMTF